MSGRSLPEPFTAEHNDTLGGLLYAHERPEDIQHRGKFGYWRMIEKRMIRDQLVAEGWDADDWRIHFEIAARVTANHRNDPSLREMQAARPMARSAPSAPSARFSDEELERLAEHFAGANDPVAQSILAKAMAGLEPHTRWGRSEAE